MSQDDAEENQERRDFFISYTGSDRQWAEWIALQLEQAGYTVTKIYCYRQLSLALATEPKHGGSGIR